MIFRRVATAPDASRKRPSPAFLVSLVISIVAAVMALVRRLTPGI